LLFFNVIGFLPYTFTITAHIVFSLGLSFFFYYLTNLVSPLILIQAFFPMYILGLADMSQCIPVHPNVYTYWTQLSSLRSFLTLLSSSLFFVAIRRFFQFFFTFKPKFYQRFCSYHCLLTFFTITALGFQEPGNLFSLTTQTYYTEYFALTLIVFITVLWLWSAGIFTRLHSDVVLSCKKIKINGKSHFIVKIKTHLAKVYDMCSSTEIMWAWIPSIAIIIYCWSGLGLLNELYAETPPGIVVKVHASQWQWAYEYSSYTDAAGTSVSFDSILLNDGSSPMLRDLVDVDNRLILPVATPIKLLVTSEDVLHSWALPSLGIKIDAVPGRVNVVEFQVDMPGVFIGQCSEFCGVGHAFMPIVVQTTNLIDYYHLLVYSAVTMGMTDFTITALDGAQVIFDQSFALDHLLKVSYLRDVMDIPRLQAIHQSLTTGTADYGFSVNTELSCPETYANKRVFIESVDCADEPLGLGQKLSYPDFYHKLPSIYFRLPKGWDVQTYISHLYTAVPSVGRPLRFLLNITTQWLVVYGACREQFSECSSCTLTPARFNCSDFLTKPATGRHLMQLCSENPTYDITTAKVSSITRSSLDVGDASFADLAQLRRFLREVPYCSHTAVIFRKILSRILTQELFPYSSKLSVWKDPLKLVFTSNSRNDLIGFILDKGMLQEVNLSYFTADPKLPLKLLNFAEFRTYLLTLDPQSLEFSRLLGYLYKSPTFGLSAEPSHKELLRFWFQPRLLYDTVKQNVYGIRLSQNNKVELIPLR
jgi:cytochrome c oxidase subunit 2